MRLLHPAAIILLPLAPLHAASGHMGEVSKSTISISASVRTQLEVNPIQAKYDPLESRLRSPAAQEFCVRTNSGTNRYLVRAEHSGVAMSTYKIHWRSRGAENAVPLDPVLSSDFFAGVAQSNCEQKGDAAVSLNLETGPIPTPPSSSRTLTLIFGPM